MSITAYFIYQTLNNQRHEANFRIIFPEIKELKDAIDEFSFQDLQGTTAINNLTAHIYVGLIGTRNQETLTQELEKFSGFVLRFYRIFYLLNNLKTSDKYYAFLTSEVSNVYRINFQFIYQAMRSQWDLSEADSVETLRGKMYQVKKQFEKIENKISDYEKKNRSM